MTVLVGTAHFGRAPLFLIQGVQPTLVLLTALMFNFTNDVCNVVYALSHYLDGTPAMIIDDHATKLSNAMVLFFVGVIFCDLANFALFFVADVQGVRVSKAVTNDSAASATVSMAEPQAASNMVVSAV